MKVSFIGKRMVVFTAHPDDEGLAAGTMHANALAGGETFLVCATYGEKGKSHLRRPLTDAELKRVRRDELVAAAKILKIDGVIFLGLPDARVRENSKKLYEKALSVIERISPDEILSFGPDGVSAHWDHITVGRAARRIAKKLKVPLAAFTISPIAAASSERREAFVKRRKFGKYAGMPKHRVPDFKVKVDPSVKARALREHRSQFGDRPPFAELPKRAREKMFGYEYFVRELL